ncbi:porin family protein [Mariprofundus ferrooxydans]|uniref:Outer membrane protein beta-barrel domain-containing protein n=1 Tax=Mariprofundus ferrooxydans PV-1 TaxID=314345 RepID=Q0EY88_9PROT|nr:porin family protein [Mariprofundus ferrooxydans]EAU54304.1 hypothetical protein SPV1_06069 [Mariprofundus ferrooxydans PV-1]KON47844.1 hypothetical protein AL013_06430 [Mariprofundus ferrooxydans]
MKRVLIGATMIMAGGVTAQAQDIKPYAGIGIGVFGLEYKEPGFAQKNNVFGGFGKFGVDINDYFGGELRLGATGQGDKTYPTGTLGAPAPFTVGLKSDYFISYLAKFQYPVSPDFRLYALAGATTGKFSRPITLGVLTLHSAATKTGFSYGFGGDFTVNDQVSVGAEWMQYWTNVEVGANMKAKLWGAVGTLTMHF